MSELTAHALLEHPETGERVDRGEPVPADWPSLDELEASGAVSTEDYDPEADKSAAPDVVEIDGVKYVKAGENGVTKDDSDAG